jgi:hypothetical protein
MKYFLITCMIIMLHNSIFCQKARQTIGVYTSVLNIGVAAIDGNEGPDFHSVFIIGGEYGKSLNKWLSINGGIEFSDHPLTRYINGTFKDSIVNGNLQFISVPVVLRADLFHFLFFTFGLIGDIQVKNSLDTKNRSGIGITGGTGFKYDFKNSTTIFVHPFYQIHNISGSNAILNAGVRMGASYRF